MSKAFIALLVSTHLISSSYMGKLEPKKSINIKSEVSGIVSSVKRDTLYSFVGKNSIVSIDTKALDIEIQSLINEISNQRKIFKIQEKRYKSKSRISTISDYEKSQEELSMRQALHSLYGLQKQLKLKKLQKSKHIFNVQNKYIGDIYIKKGEFVSMGTRIMDIYDILESKITLFVSKEDVNSLKGKDIYIDGQKSDYKITYISNITDENYISSYKVEISKPNQNKDMVFGKVVKVEFK